MREKNVTLNTDLTAAAPSLLIFLSKVCEVFLPKVFRFCFVLDFFLFSSTLTSHVSF